jgi:Rha family phage regulatory protein
MTKLVFIENNRPVTDSLTVAEVFGKEHKNVLRDIEMLDCSEEFSRLNFEQSTYINERGREYPKVNMSQDGFTFLVMGYTGKEAARFKEMYINEFNRMKQQLASPYQLPQNYKEALVALIEQVEVTEKLQLQIEHDRPKVALYDTAMSAKNNFTMERVSKTIGYGRNKLFEFLREQKILRSNNLPYQEYIDRGYFDVRQYSITHLTSGIENKTQTLVTPKGMSYIHELLVKNGKVTA